MKREFLKAIAGLKDEDIDKIMAEAGRDVNGVRSELDALKTSSGAAAAELQTYKDKVASLEKAGTDAAGIQKQLDDLKTQVAAEKAAADAKAAEEQLTKNIEASFGEKKFVNDYTRKAMISQIKDELGKPENKGKGISDIFTALTKDAKDIFANPNPADMHGMGEAGTEEISDEKARAIVGLPPLKK